jgi:hypothetical protein
LIGQIGLSADLEPELRANGNEDHLTPEWWIEDSILRDDFKSRLKKILLKSIAF